jgi:hypothetical protein
MRRVTLQRLDVLVRVIVRDLCGRDVRAFVRHDEGHDAWRVTLHRPATDRYASDIIDGRAAMFAAHSGALAALVETIVQGLVPKTSDVPGGSAE